MSFYRFMMRNYQGALSPEGALAHEMRLDKEHFPKNGQGKFNGWHKLIREHLEWKGTCDACLDAFERCWEEYVKCEKSRLNTSL